ncbi:MAG: hypothetical protein CSB15_01625 [Clostridiales bacterium]|nr:MAG: hypothetical protein CSB15_01625 [Clostridiales bacterium]
MQTKARETVFLIAKYSVVLSIIATIIVCIFFKNPIPIVLGLWFGTLISILLFYELALTISKAVQMNSAKASTYTSLKYFLRFLVYAVVLFVAAKNKNLNIYATVFGILSVKVSIYFQNLVVNKKFKRKEE